MADDKANKNKGKGKGNGEATVNSPQEAAEAPVVDANAPGDMPDGYALVTPAGGGERSWWKPEAGSRIQGRLMGRFERGDGKGAFYQVKLGKGIESVRAIRGAGNEAEVVELGTGDIVNVDERSTLKSLQPYADSDGVFDVFIHALEKVQLKGGRSFWRMNVGAKQLKAPTRPVADFTARKPLRVDDMDLPF